ncbi:MAG: cytochrome c [Rubrivivax sp.]|nr:cytochrome c [Rubrivivax sp.]
MALLALGAGLGAGALLWFDRAPALAPVLPADAVGSPAQLARGRVLALAGNCAGCHTARGGAPYAGGGAINTPFGTVFAGNLTPDVATGLGAWTSGHFWRALHHGRGLDGRRLIPAFPYTETTLITRADSDALYAWLRTLPAAVQPNRPHQLRWPYGTPLALAAWRLLFFTPGEWRDDPKHGAEWNRGAYLVNGAGHCVACHGGRNALGATADAGFGGGLIPTRNWYAPAFTRAGEASVADWPVEEIVALLRDGVAPRGRAIGPMAEVVQRSTQHLPLADLRAMAVYLKSLPVEAAAPARPSDPPDPARIEAGAKLYETHCADCHGAQGEGGALADGPERGRMVVPALAANRSVTMNPPANLVRAIALGGFGAVTAGNPRPFGMPPYAHVLSDAQIADVATWLRQREGAAAISAFDVARWRGGSED